jgi:hypothetical protein
LLSLAVPQSRQCTVTGTVTTSTSAPSASVPAATKLNACAIDSGSTACLTPQRTRIPLTGRPAARVLTASSTPSHKPNSCTWSSHPEAAPLPFTDPVTDRESDERFHGGYIALIFR